MLTQPLDYEEKFRGFLEASPDAVVIVDAAGEIVMVNSHTERIFGYETDELIGKSLEALLPERFRTRHQDHRSNFLANPKVRSMGGARELYGLRKDGTEFPAEISLGPINTSQGLLISSVIRDVTPRIVAQKELEASLREKETLLREIHHRVKNNLQIISSLLSLQAEQAKDPEIRQSFLESQGRVLTMALMHERLYQSRTLSNVNLKDYFQELVNNLSRTHVFERGHIHFHLDIENASLDPQKLIPLALIANELLSNSLKHAFPCSKTGNIFIGLTAASDRELRLVIRDDGVGLKGEINFREVQSLGLKLVQSLTEQLKGTLELKSHNGTEFWIQFPCALGH